MCVCVCVGMELGDLHRDNLKCACGSVLSCLCVCGSLEFMHDDVDDVLNAADVAGVSHFLLMSRSRV